MVSSFYLCLLLNGNLNDIGNLKKFKGTPPGIYNKLNLGDLGGVTTYFWTWVDLKMVPYIT